MTAVRRSVLLGGLLGAGAAAGAASAQVAALPGAPAVNRNLPDVVVVGAGAFGAWTALELREQGARVTLVDQYGPGNPLASSGDESRLIRSSYGDREIYTRMAEEAFGLWRQRQEEFGRRLIYVNGSLRVVPPAQLAAQRVIFDRLGLPYEVLPSDEVHRRWPQIRYDDADVLVFEPRSGVVKARESLIAVSEAFMHKGGVVRIGRAAPGPVMSGGRMDGVMVDGAPLSAGAVVFACGPWLPKVLPDLLGDRIRTPRRELFYVGSPPGDQRYRWERLPNLADHLTYTASDVDYGVKIAARTPDTPMDPDEADRTPTPFLADQVRDYVSRRMPGLVGRPIVAARVCQTEYSDNNHFIIDRHPDHANAWIAGAGSGHAFKMGPVLGKRIAARVLGRPAPSEDDALFALSRHGRAT